MTRHRRNSAVGPTASPTAPLDLFEPRRRGARRAALLLGVASVSALLLLRQMTDAPHRAMFGALAAALAIGAALIVPLVGGRRARP